MHASVIARRQARYPEHTIVELSFTVSIGGAHAAGGVVGGVVTVLSPPEVPLRESDASENIHFTRARSGDGLARISSDVFETFVHLAYARECSPECGNDGGVEL